MDHQHIQRMRVHWKKGMENFQSFFTLLGEARSEVGNDALPNWCLEEVGIGFSRVTQIAKVLRADDEARVRQDLAQAREAQRGQQAEQRRERARAREEEQARRRRQREEREAERRRQRRNIQSRQSRRRAQQRQVAAYAASVPAVTSNGHDTDLTASELVRRIKTAMTRRDAGRREWIDASVELAGLLIQARARVGENDRAFGDWLARHSIDLTRHDRAALINLGANLEAMRRVLEQTNRNSYQYIWEEVRAQLPPM
jgi:hypothetical protein